MLRKSLSNGWDFLSIWMIKFYFLCRIYYNIVWRNPNRRGKNSRGPRNSKGCSIPGSGNQPFPCQVLRLNPILFC